MNTTQTRQKQTLRVVKPSTAKPPLDANQEAYIVASRAFKKELTKVERLVKAGRYWEANTLLCDVAPDSLLLEALDKAGGVVIAAHYEAQDARRAVQG